MSRTHFWNFFTDANGSPIESADISIYLAGTEEPAAIYTNEFGTNSIKTTPQIKTNSLGYFEFWIADSSDSKAGYSNNQKFKLVATRTGIADMMIDYVDILCSVLPVDPTSDNIVANKTVSNAMAKAWNSMLIYQGMPIGRPGDTSVESDEMNKFVSNNLISRWQEHRKMNFNSNISFYGTTSESELLPWEDKEHFPSLYGAHGILEVQVDGVDRSDTVKNRLVSNALANKWEEHVDYSFQEHDISAPDFNEVTPHGLYRVNFSIPAFDLEDPNAPYELVKEYNQYNKLVSNRLIREIMYDAEIKVTLTARKIDSSDWNPSGFERNIWVYTVAHNLNTRFIGVECFRKIERINPYTGALEVIDNVFSPEDIFILGPNEIEIHSSRNDDCYVTVWGRKDLEKAMNEDSDTGGGTGDTTKYRLLLHSNIPTTQVKIEGDKMSGEWKNINSEIYLEPGDYILTFSDVDGYVTPDSMIVNIQYNRLINVIYEPQTYEMSFEVSPSGFDGQMRIVDPNGIIEDTWRSLTEKVLVPNGTYIVMFNTPVGYKTPASQSITIDNAPKVIWVTYEEAVTHYKVTFTTNVTTASATLKDSEGNTSIIVLYDGMVLTLTEGTYLITFEDITGMTAPDLMELDVTSDLDVGVEYTQA